MVVAIVETYVAAAEALSRVNPDRPYPRGLRAMAFCALPRFTRGRRSRGVSTYREPGAAKECSRPREPPGGDASWLVLVRAPRIPLTAAEALCAFLRRKSRGAQRLRSPPLPNPRAESCGDEGPGGMGSDPR